MTKRKRVPELSRREGLCAQCERCPRWDGRECVLPSGPRLKCGERGRTCLDARPDRGLR